MDSIFTPDYAIPPGETLLETIEELDITQKELALRMGRPLKTVNEIIKGKAQLTPETSLELEKVTGVPASYWNQLEAQYRESLARLNQQKLREQQITWVKQFSYKKITDLGLLTPTKDKTQQVEQLLSFLGVASPVQWQETFTRMQGAAREATSSQSELGDLSVWLRCGELKARQLNTPPYDKATFLASLQQIRKLTQQNPADVWQDVVQLCADSGVALVLVPELPKTRVSGFTHWLTPDKALIQLSLRYKTDDSLWFTFFHEAAHILLHGKKDVFLEGRDTQSLKEQQANQWASNFLIPDKHWNVFIQSLPAAITQKHITDFAHSEEIAPSIPLGRLQHRDNRVPANRFNKLRRKVTIQWSGL